MDGVSDVSADGLSSVMSALTAENVQVAASLRALSVANQQGELVMSLLESAVEVAQGPAEDGKGTTIDCRG
jgi:hypothetical protein